MPEEKEEQTSTEPFGTKEGPGHYSPPQFTGPNIPQAPVPAYDVTAVEGTEAEEVNYNDMTVAELKDLAHKRGVEIHSDMLKDDIIAALKSG